MNNILIFDASSQTVFLGYKTEKEQYFTASKFEKKQMNTKLPELLIPLSEKMSEILPARTIIGIGPGSFTGIKTGLALFLSILYTKGIEEVETVSSSRFLRMLYPDISRHSITAIPFNKGQYFVSCFDEKGASLTGDMFISSPFTGFEEILKSCGIEQADLIIPEKESGDLEDFIASKIKNVVTSCKKPLFLPEMFAEIKGTDKIRFIEDPLFLNYVNLPANIAEGANIYINENSEVKNENSKDLC